MKRITGSIIVSALAGIVSAIALGFMHTMQGRPVFFVALGIWWAIIIASHWFFSFEKKHLFLQLSTSLSLVCLLSLIDGWNPLSWFIILLSIPMFAFVWHWSAEMSREHAEFSYKTWRRIVMMLWVMDVFGVMSGLFSLPIFFQNTSHAIVALLGAVISAGTAAMIWQLYSDVTTRDIFFWSGILALAMFEAIWILLYMPLGYFVLGLVATWVWYVIQLFMRFNLTRGGVIWKQQQLFLITNAILFTMILYLARWV